MEALGVLLFLVAVVAFVVLVWQGWVHGVWDLVNLARGKRTDHVSWKVAGISALVFVVSGTASLTIIGAEMDREEQQETREYERQTREENERQEREIDKIRREMNRGAE